MDVQPRDVALLIPRTHAPTWLNPKGMGSNSQNGRPRTPRRSHGPRSRKPGKIRFREPRTSTSDCVISQSRYRPFRRSMIRTRGAALAQKWTPVFPRDKREAFARRSAQISTKIEGGFEEKPSRSIGRSPRRQSTRAGVAYRQTSCGRRRPAGSRHIRAGNGCRRESRTRSFRRQWPRRCREGCPR
jgi:hypothetical protein